MAMVRTQIQLTADQIAELRASSRRNYAARGPTGCELSLLPRHETPVVMPDSAITWDTPPLQRSTKVDETICTDPIPLPISGVVGNVVARNITRMLRFRYRYLRRHKCLRAN